MERMQIGPWGHAFGWKHLTLADGRKVKLTVQKNGIVPIYTAIAEGGEELYDFVYVDSGYLNPLNLPPASGTDYKDFPALYQSTRTAYLHHLGRGDVPNPNPTPASFWYDAALYTPGEQATLQTNLAAKRDASDESVKATGKYRLYQQARRGLPLSLTPVAIEGINNNTEKTTGLYTASDGTYWKVDIEARQATPEVTFTRFDLTDETALGYTSALASATDAASLVMETYILSKLELSAESYTVSIKDNGTDWEYPSYSEWVYYTGISETYALAEPVSPYQGWKFNWDGNKAAIVLIQSITAKSYYVNFFLWACDYRSHVLELTFSDSKDGLGVYTFRADIETLETNDWIYTHALPQYWIWNQYDDGVAPLFVRQHIDVAPLSFPNPTATPIYGYYVTTGTSHKNNALELVRITLDASPDTGYQLISPCGVNNRAGGYGNASMQYGRIREYFGGQRLERVTFGSIDISVTTEQQTMDVSYPIQIQGSFQAPYGTTCGWSLDYWNQTSFCSLPPTENISFSTTDYGPGTVEQYEYRLNGTIVAETTVISPDGHVRVIIPRDNAEAVFIAQSQVEYLTRTRGASTYADVTVGIRYGDVSAYNYALGQLEVIASGFDTAGHSVAGYPTSVSTDYYYTSELSSALSYIGRDGKVHTKEYNAALTSDVDASYVSVGSVPSLFRYINSLEDEKWNVTFRSMQGVGPEIHLRIDCSEAMTDPEWSFSTDVYSGYPGQIVSDYKTVPIGFA